MAIVRFGSQAYEDGKYIVFKREVFESFLIAMGEEGIHGGMGGTEGIDINEFCENILRDAVVIRTGDVFAGPALHAYAAAIGVAVSVLRSHADSSKGGTADRLSKIADYFSERATEADMRQGKLPD